MEMKGVAWWFLLQLYTEVFKKRGEAIEGLLYILTYYNHVTFIIRTDAHP